MWDLIALFPDRCISIYLVEREKSHVGAIYLGECFKFPFSFYSTFICRSPISLLANF